MVGLQLRVAPAGAACPAAARRRRRRRRRWDERRQPGRRQRRRRRVQQPHAKTERHGQLVAAVAGGLKVEARTKELLRVAHAREHLRVGFRGRRRRRAVRRRRRRRARRTLGVEEDVGRVGHSRKRGHLAQGTASSHGLGGVTGAVKVDADAFAVVKVAQHLARLQGTRHRRDTPPCADDRLVSAPSHGGRPWLVVEIGRARAQVVLRHQRDYSWDPCSSWAAAAAPAAPAWGTSTRCHRAADWSSAASRW